MLQKNSPRDVFPIFADRGEEQMGYLGLRNGSRENRPTGLGNAKTPGVRSNDLGGNRPRAAGIRSETFGNTTWAEHRLFESVDEPIFHGRNLDTRRITTWRRDGDGLPLDGARLIVRGLHDPDLAMDEVWITASVARKESPVLTESTAASISMSSIAISSSKLRGLKQNQVSGN